MNKNIIIDYLKGNLSKYRFRHTIGVAKTAKALAEKYEADIEKAYIAGLLHDCAKEISLEKMINILKKNNASIDEISKDSTALLHGITGAFLAKELYNIDDEIFDAIKYHTTGKANMNLLTKIIYIADFIEPNRSFSEAKEVYDVAFENIDKAIILSTSIVIVHTVNKGGLIHPNTVEARNYLLSCDRSDAVSEKDFK